MIKQSSTFSEFIESLPIYQKSLEKHTKTLVFQVTDSCNLACSYCYQINKHKNFMSFDVAKKMIDYIFDNRENPNSYFWEGTTGGLEFHFIGGEPLLNFSLIKEIILYIEKRMLEIFNHPWFMFHKYLIDSNGVKYFEPEVQDFISKCPYLIDVAITLDGDKELHDSCRLFPDGTGSWDIAKEAALYNQKYYNKQNTKITLSPFNVNFTSKAILNMIDLGFKEVYKNEK